MANGQFSDILGQVFGTPVRPQPLPQLQPQQITGLGGAATSPVISEPSPLAGIPPIPPSVSGVTPTTKDIQISGAQPFIQQGAPRIIPRAEGTPEQKVGQRFAQARLDLTGILPLAQESAQLGSQAALDVFGQAVPQQLQAFQQGNVAAQQALLGGLPQIQAAILGQPTDLSALQAQQLQIDPSFVQQQLPEFQTGIAPLPQVGDIPGITAGDIQGALLRGVAPSQLQDQRRITDGINQIAQSEIQAARDRGENVTGDTVRGAIKSGIDATTGTVSGTLSEAVEGLGGLLGGLAESDTGKFSDSFAGKALSGIASGLAGLVGGPIAGLGAKAAIAGFEDSINEAARDAGIGGVSEAGLGTVEGWAAAGGLEGQIGRNRAEQAAAADRGKGRGRGETGDRGGGAASGGGSDAASGGTGGWGDK